VEEILLYEEVAMLRIGQTESSPSIRVPEMPHLKIKVKKEIASLVQIANTLNRNHL